MGIKINGYLKLKYYAKTYTAHIKNFFLLVFIYYFYNSCVPKKHYSALLILNEIMRINNDSLFLF